MKRENVPDYLVEIGIVYAMVESDTSLTDALKSCKLDALRTIASRTHLLAEECWDPLIVNGYAKKKSKFILEAKNKTQVTAILKPAEPNYNGNCFVDSVYQVDEEEAIAWSKASLRVPLNEPATKRLIELMRRIFPHERLEPIEDQYAARGRKEN